MSAKTHAGNVTCDIGLWPFVLKIDGFPGTFLCQVCWSWLHRFLRCWAENRQTQQAEVNTQPLRLLSAWGYSHCKFGFVSPRSADAMRCTGEGEDWKSRSHDSGFMIDINRFNPWKLFAEYTSLIFSYMYTSSGNSKSVSPLYFLYFTDLWAVLFIDFWKLIRQLRIFYYITVFGNNFETIITLSSLSWGDSPMSIKCFCYLVDGQS